MVGTLVAVSRRRIVIEVSRRFEVTAEEVPASLRGAIGKPVGVVVLDGHVRWRLAEAAPEPRRGERP